MVILPIPDENDISTLKMRNSYGKLTNCSFDSFDQYWNFFNNFTHHRVITFTNLHYIW